jgi:hypothetical protein
VEELAAGGRLILRKTQPEGWMLSDLTAEERVPLLQPREGGVGRGCCGGRVICSLRLAVFKLCVFWEVGGWERWAFMGRASACQDFAALAATSLHFTLGDEGFQGGLLGW